jgi:hypothetical protein
LLSGIRHSAYLSLFLITPPPLRLVAHLGFGSQPVGALSLGPGAGGPEGRGAAAGEGAPPGREGRAWHQGRGPSSCVDGRLQLARPLSIPSCTMIGGIKGEGPPPARRRHHHR